MRRTPLLTRWASLSLALAALPAAAQTVQLNGVIDVMAGQRQLSGANKVRTVDSGGMTTSRFGVEGSEDLGDGLKAQFVLSGFLRADTGESGRFGTTDGGWRRMAYVGLQSNSWGSLRLGRNGTPTFGLAVRFNPFADSTVVAPYMLHMYPGGQPLAAPMNSPVSAADNSVAWLSPTWGVAGRDGVQRPEPLGHRRELGFRATGRGSGGGTEQGAGGPARRCVEVG
jgi:predicted porin